MSWWEVLALLGGGLAAGVFNTMAGGGSSLTVPLLVIVGVPGNAANGSNRIGILASNLAAAGSFRRLGVDGVSRVWPYLAPIAAGSLLGSYGISRLADEAFETLFGLLLVPIVLAAVWTSRDRSGDCSSGPGPGAVDTKPGVSIRGDFASPEDLGPTKPQSLNPRAFSASAPEPDGPSSAPGDSCSAPSARDVPFCSPVDSEGPPSGRDDPLGTGARDKEKLVGAGWHPAATAGAFFAVGVYGGAIQAGLGLLLLAVLNRSGLDLVAANSVKSVANVVITTLALPVFVVSGHVQWVPALVLAAGFTLGGWLGAPLVVRGGERWVRVAVVLAAVVLSARLLGLLG